MGLNEIRLVTNNPKKIRELEENGIIITEVVGTKVHVKDGNESYLKTKASHGKHRFHFD
ncbi:hypothetical protein PBPRA1520 [Photobacterium profundum SS9]|nr:hypothetical protein PBPRA1520 [Photobacterium profundum SS9]